MDDQERQIIKAFVRANLGTSRAEAERRIREVRLTYEELIYAWYRAGVEPRGGQALKTELMTRILGAETFDEWALIAVSFSLAPYRTYAVEQLRRYTVVTDSGIALLRHSGRRSLRKLAEELNERQRAAS